MEVINPVKNARGISNGIKKYLLRNPLATKSGVIFILAALVFGVLAPADFVHAGFPEWLVGGIFDGIGGLVLSFITAALSFLVPVAAFFAGLAGSFMYAVLSADLFYTKCTASVDPCFIDIAWTLARDIVNIALIVALIVIALFTIIGNENYGARKALVPFIIIAIIINFSRVFVGVVVDVSNLVMSVFVSAMPTFEDIGSLWKLSGVQLGGEFSLSTTTAMSNVLQSIVSIIYFMAMAFIFALYGIIFAVRYGVLWMLTIMSPIALAAWLFPSTKKIFTLWKDQLVQWSIIGIPILFFLWIALISFAQLNVVKAPETALDSFGLGSFFQKIFPNIFLLLMLFIAFAFGMKTSAMGSGMIINTGKRWGKTAGMATSKFAGKMAWRGAVAGGRKVGAGAGAAGARWIRPALQKITQKIPIVNQWQPGYASKRYDAANEKERIKMLKKTGLRGKFDRRRRVIDGNTPWGSLTKDQQDQFAEQMRSKTAKKAAALLGGGAKMGKRIASAPWNTLTPEEQKAIWSTVSRENLRKAKKDATMKEMKNFEDKDYSVDELKRTITHETNLGKRLAAQILLLQKNGANMTQDKKEEIAKKAKASGLGSEVGAYLDPKKGEFQRVFGDADTPQGSRALRNHTAAASKAVDDELKAIENLTEQATRSLMKTATNIHTKVAAAQKLANDKALTRQDFSDFEKFVQNSAQLGQLIKRYIHFAKEGLPATDPNSIASIVKRMPRRDYYEIHEELFSKSNLAKAKEFYRAAADAGIAELTKNGKLRQGFQGFITNNPAEIPNNPAVYDYLRKSKKKSFAYNIP